MLPSLHKLLLGPAPKAQAQNQEKRIAAEYSHSFQDGRTDYYEDEDHRLLRREYPNGNVEYYEGTQSMERLVLMRDRVWNVLRYYNGPRNEEVEVRQERLEEDTAMNVPPHPNHNRYDLLDVEEAEARGSIDDDDNGSQASDSDDWQSLDDMDECESGDEMRGGFQSPMHKLQKTAPDVPKEYTLKLHCIPHNYPRTVNDSLDSPDMYRKGLFDWSTARLVGEPSPTREQSIVHHVQNDVKMRSLYLWDHAGYDTTTQKPKQQAPGSQQEWDSTRLVPYNDLLNMLNISIIAFKQDLTVTGPYTFTETADTQGMNAEEVNTLRAPIPIASDEYKGLFYLRKDFTGKRVVQLGDYHGSLWSITEALAYMNANGMFKEDGISLKCNVIVLCSGDILDRTPYSLESLYLLLRLKRYNPEQVYYILGNHEIDPNQWENAKQLGAGYEAMYEYTGMDGTKNQSTVIKQKLIELFKWWPASIIMDTDVGKLQMVHGCFDRYFNVPDQGPNTKTHTYFRAFADFCASPPNATSPTFAAHMAEGMQREYHSLAWRDVRTASYTREYEDNSTHMMFGKTGKPRDPATTAEISEYMNRFGLKMLLRGHQDLACCSLGVHPKPVRDDAPTPEWWTRLQAENKPDPDPDKAGPFRRICRRYGYEHVDATAFTDARPLTNEQVEARRGTFCYNPAFFDGDSSGYELYVLELSEQDTITKTLTGTHDDDKKDDIKVVITSSSTTSKRDAPVMLHTTFLIIDEKA